MSAYVLSPESLQDLQDIWDFIAIDSTVSADKVIDQFFTAFERLATQPGMGHRRDDLTGKEVRFWPVGFYLIVYRSKRPGVQVVAVLHGARDIPEVIRKRQG